MRVMRASDDLVLPMELTVTARFRHAVMAEGTDGVLISVLAEGRLAGAPTASWWIGFRKTIVSSRASALRGSTCRCRAVASAWAEAYAMMGRFLALFSPRESSTERRHAARRGCVTQAACPARSRAKAILSSTYQVLDVGSRRALTIIFWGRSACCAACGPGEARMRANIERSLDGMAPLSRAMLSHALDGRYPEVVLDFHAVPRCSPLACIYSTWFDVGLRYGIRLVCCRAGSVRLRRGGKAWRVRVQRLQEFPT